MRLTPGPRGSMRLRDLLALVAATSVVAGVILPALVDTQRNSKREQCASNLRMLGWYVQAYIAKYGCDRNYPPREGQGFWQSLRVSPWPGLRELAEGDDIRFVCPLSGSRAGVGITDYREPGPGLPGGRVSDGLTQPRWPIACDRPTNHDPAGQDDMNILLFNGSVHPSAAGSPEWTMAMNYTQ